MARLKHKPVQLKRLRQLFNYKKSDGSFYWKSTTSNRVKIGQQAGVIIKGYRHIGVDGVRYAEHHLSWLMAAGKWPESCIDHIDGNPLNNNIKNLREVSHRKNMQNLRVHQQGRLPGTKKEKRRLQKPWRATVTVQNKRIDLGYFETEKEAHLSYVEYCKYLERL